MRFRTNLLAMCPNLLISNVTRRFGGKLLWAIQQLIPEIKGEGDRNTTFELIQVFKQMEIVKLCDLLTDDSENRPGAILCYF